MRNENGGEPGLYGWHEEELTPEQKRYLQIVNSEKARQAVKKTGYGEVRSANKRPRDIVAQAEAELKADKKKNKAVVAVTCLLIIGVCCGLLAWLYFSKS